MTLNWIEPERYKIDSKKKYSASYVRKIFLVRDGLVSASVEATALGVYTPYINGKRCTEEWLLPYFTDYTKRVQVQTFPVTELLHTGDNIFIAEIGDGWYRGNIGAFNKTYYYGDKLAFAARLTLTYSDGVTETIETDSSWEATQNGPLGENDLKIREVYNANKEAFLWVPDSRGWHSCVEASHSVKLVPTESVPVLEQETFPAKLLRTPDGSTVLDFGQNLAGHVRFTVTGTANDVVELLFGETLDENGDFTMKNLQGDDKPKEKGPLRLGQHLIYTLKDGTQTFCPHFLHSGYRYTKVLQWPGELEPTDVASVAVYSALPVTGSFSCSDAAVNCFFENTKWSQKSNFVDIPTDCPHRERAGWTGDFNVFQETADYLVDTRQFTRKWMEDFVGMQDEKGGLPYIVPDIPALGASRSSAGWSDAISTVPLGYYRAYGDPVLMEQCYEAARRFVEYNRIRASKKPLRHLLWKGKYQKYILDTGFHYGEWLEPGSDNLKDGLKAMLSPDAEVATAWFYYGTKNVAEMAGLLGKTEEQEKYATLAQNIKDAYRMQFMPDGHVQSTQMCRYVRPVYMGLATEEESRKIVADLNQLCIENNYHIGTGFLTTYQLLPVLTDYGYADTAYRILLNHDRPGWLYEVDRGATTVWEGWDAVKEDGSLTALSQNHYSPATGVAWLFSRAAGIRPLAPGYESVLICPYPGSASVIKKNGPFFSYVKAELKTVQGIVSVYWEIKDREFQVTVRVPAHVDATLILPDGTTVDHASSGTYSCFFK